MTDNFDSNGNYKRRCELRYSIVLKQDSQKPVHTLVKTFVYDPETKDTKPRQGDHWQVMSPISDLAAWFEQGGYDAAQLFGDVVVWLPRDGSEFMHFAKRWL